MNNLAYQYEDIQESVKTLHKAQKLNNKNTFKRVKIGNKYYRLNIAHYRAYKVIWNILQGVMCLGGAVALYVLILMYGGI